MKAYFLNFIKSLISYIKIANEMFEAFLLAAIVPTYRLFLIYFIFIAICSYGDNKTMKETLSDMISTNPDKSMYEDW